MKVISSIGNALYQPLKETKFIEIIRLYVVAALFTYLLYRLDLFTSMPEVVKRYWVVCFVSFPISAVSFKIILDKFFSWRSDFYSAFGMVLWLFKTLLVFVLAPPVAIIFVVINLIRGIFIGVTS